MRKIILASISILIFCFCSLAQSSENSPCPTGVNVTGPSGLVKPGEKQTFAAEVDNPGNYKIKYNWLVSGGEIIEGQGTSMIKVVQPEDSAGSNLTATVEVSVLSGSCETISDSETAVICDCIDPFIIDEFSGSLAEVKKENLDNFANVLQNAPNAQGYMIWYSRKNLSDNIVEREIQKTIEYLTKEKGLDKARIVIKTSLFEEDFVRFWIVPAGASPPTS